jgi:hypothetical protein
MLGQGDGGDRGFGDFKIVFGSEENLKSADAR